MPRLALRLFGPMEVTLSDGTPLPRPRTRAGLWLLALLALKSERPQERARLAQTLWPDTVETAALANLRRTLTDLRAVLGPDAEAILAPSPATLALDRTLCESDVARFDADPERELSLYRGELLEGCAEEWVFSERRARAEVCRNARIALARKSPPAEAIPHLEAALALEPLDESVARALLEALASEGKISEALGVFRRLREGLRALRLSPEPETAALFAALRERLAAPGSSRSPAPLSSPLTSFVGREAERETLLGELNAGSRLLTLLGPGGVGKTRLAREIAAALPPEKPLLGFVDCSAVTDARALPQALTRALDLRVPAGSSHADVLETALDDGALFLDNLEQVQGSLAPFLTSLLSRRPLVQIVATSRTRLRVPGEFVVRLCGLPRESASRLFAARAVAAGARRETLDESAVETLCERLDGLPLALELAASWSELLAPPEILARLGERFALLKGRGAERGLEATLEWSWARLPESQKTWLRALALLPGAWTQDVGAATLEMGELQALDAFAALADASWLVLEPGRCRMLESLRAFVLARTPPETRLETLERLWRFWELRSKTLTDDRSWMSALDADLESLRLTLDDALARPERAARGISLLITADMYFGFRGLAAECLGRTETLLARLSERDPIRPQALAMAGGSALWTGEIERARRALEEAVALCPETARERAYFLGHLGVALRRGGDLLGAERRHREARRIHVEEGRRNPALLEQMRLGVALRERGELSDARIALREACKGDELLRAGALAEWARLERLAGDVERSAELYAESLALHRALGNQPEIEKLLSESAGTLDA